MCKHCKGWLRQSMQNVAVRWNKVTAVWNVSAAQLWHFRFTLLTGAICYNCDFPCRQVTFSMADFKISTVFLDFWFTATKTSKMLKRLTIMHIFPKSSQVSLWDIVSFYRTQVNLGSDLWVRMSVTYSIHVAMQWCNLVANFGTNASGDTWSPIFEPMHNVFCVQSYGPVVKNAL